MATPLVGVASHGQATCSGGRPRPAPLQGWLVAAKAFYHGSCLQKAVVPPAAKPLGAAARGAPVRGSHQRLPRKGQPVGGG
ncbi:hypothetical protein B296_00024450 [Ensete ventricosum]|uniref:Uncharacterized protein n=1 Tax=Ensete ventricosum TaxID=4639 RepID=A0A426Y4I6_ENSVE|nr:hypothetical protein B296_00024450 [Ensete ventricosum]